MASSKRRRKRRSTKPVVFISFATADLPLIGVLREQLIVKTANKVVFYFAPRDIPGGLNWQQHIVKNLTRAKCVLVFLSPTSAASQWVLFEAGFAYGRRQPVIPVGIRGLRVEKQKPPLSSLQGVNIRSPNAMNELLDLIGHHLRRRFPLRFAGSDYTQLPDNDAPESSVIYTQALLTRPEIYRQVIRLVEECDINAEIRATSTVYDPDDSQDDSFRTYLTTLARKCGTAKTIGGRLKYHIVLGITRGRSGRISRANRRSIVERVKFFAAAKALQRLKMFEINEKWSLNLLLVNREHCVFGFPEDADDPKLQYGVLISGTEFVTPLVEWYDRCIEGRAKPLDWKEFIHRFAGSPSGKRNLPRRPRP